MPATSHQTDRPTIFLQPRAWTLQLRDLDELKPELLHLSLVLAHNADETGEVRVFRKSLALQLGLDPENEERDEQRRVGHLISQLARIGLLHPTSDSPGRGHPSVWQLVRA
jgi:hypothetical protein